MDLCWISHFSILIYANIFNGTEICKSFSIDGRLYLTMAGRVHTDVRRGGS